MATAEELLEAHMADPNAHGGAFGPADRRATTALRTDLNKVQKDVTAVRLRVNGLHAKATRIDNSLTAHRAAVDDKFEAVDARFDNVDRKFDLLFAHLGIVDPED